MRTATRVLFALSLSACALFAVSIASAQVRLPSGRGSLNPVTRLHNLANPQVRQHMAAATAQDLSATDLSTFQTNLQNLVNWLAQTPVKNPNQAAVINDLQTQIAGLTPDQVSTLASDTDVAAFSTAVATVLTTQPGPPTVPPTDPPADLSPPQYGICAPTAGPPPIPSDPGTERALLITLEVLQGLQIVADDFANLNIDILGEGTNAALVTIAIVADEIVFALQTTKDQLEFCDINVEASQVTSNWQNTIVIDTDIATLGANVINSFVSIDNQLTAMNTDIDNHLATIAFTNTNQYTQINNQLTAFSTNLSNQITAVDVDINAHTAALDVDVNNSLSAVDADVKNTTTAVDTAVDAGLAHLDGDVQNRATQVDTEINTYQTLDLRLKIEHVLSQGENVESFQIPLADGGYLETVRAIVSDVISKLLAVSQSVGGATKYMALGDSALAAKQFKTAYANYEAAYQTAVR